MNQRLLSILVVLVFVSGFSEDAAGRAPNIVFIVSDDQAWTDFGFMGHGAVRTPTLDKLAEEGAVFPNGYVPTALCRPSLASLLTGLYGHQHGITSNDPPDGVDRRLMERYIREAPALPRLLAKAGYRSYQSGKFWEGVYQNAGFSAGMTTEGRHGGPGLKIGRETMEPILRFINEHRDQPFFLWYAPMMPHTPHNPPERLLSKYRQPGRHEAVAKYLAMIEWFDETCGTLLKAIDDAGLRDNTLIVFLADNGWIQATERRPHPEVEGWRVMFGPKSKLSSYDGGLRTPVVLRWPGKVTPGRYLDLVTTIDLAPTALQAVGMAVPEEMPGLSLLPVVSGARTPLVRDAIFGEIFLHTARDIHKPVSNLTHRWVRRGDWKLIVPEGGGSPELYNLLVDPCETVNHAEKEPDLLRDLSRVLDLWWKPGVGPAD